MTLENFKKLDKEGILDMFGLETKRSASDYVVPAIALFGLGALIGTGIGLLVAPRPGRELREDISRRLQAAPEALARLPQRAMDAVHLNDGKMNS